MAGTDPVRTRAAAVAVLMLLAGPALAACSGDDEGDKNQPPAAKETGLTGPCAPRTDPGELDIPAASVPVTGGSFALSYELSDGRTGCKVVEDAKAGGSAQVVGKSQQIGIDFGDADLGLTVDLASFAEADDPPLALGAIRASMGLQAEQGYYNDPVGTQCVVTLTSFTASEVAGWFECKDVEGLRDFAGPLGGEPTEADVVHAFGWWRATS